ncbi:MAG: S8 family serine peptidase [Leptolyngbyaceae cyanobacterium RM2_2_21]|nr:S8 family serine peptidase [Leptolyngbyaceae cyanobacterium RM2_2_21]
MVTSDRSDAAGYSTGAYTTGFGGTSSACPVVAGVAALVISVNPYLKAYEVRRILQETADKIVDSSTDPQLGFKYGTYDDKGHSFWFWLRQGQCGESGAGSQEPPTLISSPTANAAAEQHSPAHNS